jgi:hypothetical protein
MKKALSFAIVSLLVLNTYPTHAAVIKNGATCSKVGQIKNISTGKFTCTKAGKKLKWIFKEKTIPSLECADVSDHRPIHYILWSQSDEELLRVVIDNTIILDPSIMYMLCTHHPSKIDLIKYLATKIKPQWIDDYNYFINRTSYPCVRECYQAMKLTNENYITTLQIIHTKLFENESIAEMFVQSDYRFLKILPPHVKTLSICDIAYRNFPIDSCVQLIPREIFTQITKFGARTKPALFNSNTE